MIITVRLLFLLLLLLLLFHILINNILLKFQEAIEYNLPTDIGKAKHTC